MPQIRQHIKLMALCIVCLIAVSMFGFSLPVSDGADNQSVVVIKPGMSTQAIGGLLQEQGLITSTLFFRIVVRVEGLDNSLQAGEYNFKKEMPVRQIVAMLADGDTTYKQFTIPEGFTVNQIAALLESKKVASADKFKALATNYVPYDYVTPEPQADYRVEGYLFPDTYRVAAGTSEERLMQMMASHFNEKFTPQMRQRANGLGLSIQEVIVLASLVEREAKLPQDRPVIAAVFLKRLNLGMPLQSCATIQYILGEPKPELTVADTEIASPYNTYQHTGLPPGPIANPGLASITAVLYPAQTDYLYFVASKDGSHHFSRTYQEHLAAIKMLSQ